MIYVIDTVDQVVQPFVMLNDRIISKGYTFHHICGVVESWKEFIEKKYIEGSKQIFYLGGDYEYELDFIDNPDLAQTFAFLSATLGKELKLTGLDNLRLKETDRVAALKTELEKLGISVSVDGNTMTVSGSISAKEVRIETYNDHRMAMSAAVMSAVSEMEIENSAVVTKSFPTFWSQLRLIGFTITE